MNEVCLVHRVCLYTCAEAVVNGDGGGNNVGQLQYV